MPIGVKVSTAVMALSMAAVTILRMASLCRLADGTMFFMMFSSVRVLLGYPTIPWGSKPGNRGLRPPPVRMAARPACII